MDGDAYVHGYQAFGRDEAAVKPAIGQAGG